MELTLILFGAAMIGIAIGILVSRFWVVPTFNRWYLERRLDRLRPPKGTRPSGVRVRVLGITYDLTDSLLPVGDDAAGTAVWAAVGPPHVRFQYGDEVEIDLGRPEPKMTRVELRMTGPPDDIRFENLDEIRERYGITE